MDSLSVRNVVSVVYYKRVVRLFCIAGLLSSLSACDFGNPPLYYWGNYQNQLYSYFQKNTAPEEQITELESNIQIAQGENLRLPPGYYAHLGMLYAEVGQYEKAQTAFLTEETLYPESRTYMEFLLKSSAGISSGTTHPLRAEKTLTKTRS